MKGSVTTHKKEEKQAICKKKKGGGTDLESNVLIKIRQTQKGK